MAADSNPIKSTTECELVGFNFDLREFNHATVYVLVDHRWTDVYLFGYDPKCKNISGFGGAREGDETVIQTATREFMEETNGAVCSSLQINDAIRHASQICHQETTNGINYIFIIRLEINIAEVLDRFDILRSTTISQLRMATDETIRKTLRSHLEMSRLVPIPVASLKRSVQTARSETEIITTDINGNQWRLRVFLAQTCWWLYRSV